MQLVPGDDRVHAARPGRRPSDPPYVHSVYNVQYYCFLSAEIKESGGSFSDNYYWLLYSWRFSCYSAPIHWLVHGHCFPPNATSGQHCENYDVKRETVHCYPLLHVIAGISARFSNFAFVLFWYITNHLMTGPLGNSGFCFPGILMFPSTSSRETKFTVPLGTSH